MIVGLTIGIRYSTIKIRKKAERGASRMVFLIDFENVGNTGMHGTDQLAPTDTVVIFYSDSNSHIEKRYLQDIEASKCTFEACKLVKAYKNALDFYIAAKTGELFGGGYRGVVAIVSRDAGFKAVRDYWIHRAKPGRHIVINESIERAILSASGAGESGARTRALADRMSICSIEKFHSEYESKRRVSDFLTQHFAETPLADRIADIGAILDASKNPKELYLSTLRAFGRDNGRLAYHVLKEYMLAQAEKSPAPEDKAAQKEGETSLDSVQFTRALK